MNFQQFLTVYFWSLFLIEGCVVCKLTLEKGAQEFPKEIISCHPGYFFLSNITIKGPGDI